MNDAPKIDTHLKFHMEKIDAELRKGYAFEASPLGPYYRLRFFNDVESVMLLGNRDQLRQIHREIGSALDLGTTRKKRLRRERQTRPRT